MKLTYPLFVLIIICMLLINKSMAANLVFSDVDFENRIETSDFLYAPLVGTTINDGVFWYRKYDQEVLEPTQLGTLRSVFVRMYPESHKNGIHGKFLTSNQLNDARQHLMPDNAILCEPNDTLIEKMVELALPHSYKVTRGGYPNLCSLQIIYYAMAGSELEQNFLSFIEENQVVKVEFEIIPESNPIDGDVIVGESIFSVSIN